VNSLSCECDNFTIQIWACFYDEAASEGVSMKHKGYLLATAAGAAAAVSGGAAQSADLAVKTPTPVVAPSWAGFYIGVNAGANYQQGLNSGDPYSYAGGGGGSTAAAGFIGGGQVGYNWQHGNFVFGLEGDISGLTGKGTGAKRTGSDSKQYANQMKWLSTFRARFGLAVGDTMVYTTGGLAVGGVKNSLTGGFAGLANKSLSQTKAGWTVGGGVEHMLDAHWTIALEALFVDLGTSTATLTNGKTAKFSNEAVVGRFKVNYKF
jgi:outer membrane immunogenic protein